MYDLYNNELVYKYVNGLDLEEDIDELESDYRFMMQVIKFTKDKKMYNLCSDEIKSNYEFVKFIIELFKDDIKFITEVADNYLMSSNRDSICTKELIVLMNNLTTKNNKTEIGVYGLRAAAFNIDELSNIYSCLRYAKNDKELKELGMGFMFVTSEYSSSEIIMSYLASSFINRIFYNNEQYKFEELIHVLIKDIKIFDKKKINNFLINYIRTKDTYLADYVSCHPELLSTVKQDINKIEGRWDIYIDLLNRRRVGIVLDYVYKYHMEKGCFINFCCYKVLDKVVEKLGLENIFNSNKETDEDSLTPDIELFKENELDFEKINFTNELTSFINMLWEKDALEEYREDYNNDKSKAKVLKVDFDKRREI